MVCSQVIGEEVRVNGLNYILDQKDNTAIVGSNFDAKGDVIIPATITYQGTSYKVTEIGKVAFAYPKQGFLRPANENITSVTLPEGIVTIGENAFNHCSNLRTIVIPNSVKVIKKNAFYKAGIENITWGTGLIMIEGGAFAGTNLRQVSIPNSVKHLGSAFSGCKKLEKAIIGNGVSVISKNTFDDCQALRTVKLGNHVTKIEIGTFWFCNALTDVQLPESLETLETSVFNACNSLVSLKIPANVKNMEVQVIACCKNFETLILTSKTIPYSDSTVYMCPKYKGVKYTLTGQEVK